LRKELKISSETTDKILAELFTAAYRWAIEADKRAAEIDKKFAETEK
jgi:hypothetical protein